MSPHYLWVTGAMELLTFFVIAPALAVAIGYAAWKRKPKNFGSQHCAIATVTSGAASILLLGFAKWLNADVRTALYFLQFVCVLLSFLLWGVFMGCGSLCASMGLALAQGNTSTEEPADRTMTGVKVPGYINHRENGIESHRVTLRFEGSCHAQSQHLNQSGRHLGDLRVRAQRIWRIQPQF